MLNNIVITYIIIPPKLNEKFRDVDFISDFTYVQYALRLRHDTRQLGLLFRMSSAVIA